MTPYEITDIRHPENPDLRRIRALKDHYVLGVFKGDLGGYVEHKGNLDQQGDCWIGDDAIVMGNARVMGNALVSDHAHVSGTARVSGTSKVYGHAIVSEDALISGEAEVFGNAQITGRAYVFGGVVYDHVVLGGDIWMEFGLYGGSFHYGGPQMWNRDFKECVSEKVPLPISLFHLDLSKWDETVGVSYSGGEVELHSRYTNDLIRLLRIPTSRLEVRENMLTARLSDVMSLWSRSSDVAPLQSNP